MKRTTTKEIEFEIGKVVSQLTQEFLAKGLVLTRFETGGTNSYTKILVFSSSETTKKEVIFVRSKSDYRWYEEGIRTHRVYTSTISETSAGTGFLDSMFKEADKEEVAEFIVFEYRGKSFVVSEEERQEIAQKRKERSRLHGISQKFGSREFQVSKLKTVKGFKRSSATIKRLPVSYLAYEIIGEKSSKKVTYR